MADRLTKSARRERPAAVLATACAAAMLCALAAPQAAHAQATSNDAKSWDHRTNIWDHKDHQPTEAEIRAAEQRAGVRTSGQGGTTDAELEALRRSILEQSRPRSQDNTANPAGTR